MCVARNFGTLIAVKVISPPIAKIQAIRIGDLNMSPIIEIKVRREEVTLDCFFRAIACK
jgi:hypothetical protein